MTWQFVLGNYIYFVFKKSKQASPRTESKKLYKCKIVFRTNIYLVFENSNQASPRTESKKALELQHCVRYNSIEKRLE